VAFQHTDKCGNVSRKRMNFDGDPLCQRQQTTTGPQERILTAFDIALQEIDTTDLIFFDEQILINPRRSDVSRIIVRSEFFIRGTKKCPYQFYATQKPGVQS